MLHTNSDPASNALSLQRRYAYGYGRNGDNRGEAATTYYHGQWHKNVAFYDHLAVNQTPPQIMFYSTPWILTHSKHAEAALATKFTLGNPTGENSGFQKQQNVGNTGGGTYLGTLWVSNNINQPPYNQTAIDIADGLIIQHPAVLEKTLCALPFIAIAAAALLGLKYIATRSCVRAVHGKIQQRHSTAQINPTPVEHDDGPFILYHYSREAGSAV